MYAVNLDEMAGDLTDYPSLAQFFTRELKNGVRPIDMTQSLVSTERYISLICFYYFNDLFL